MNQQKKQPNNKPLFYISIGSSVFLLLLYLNHTVFKLDFVLIGVVREMLSTPALLLQPFLMIKAGMAFDLSNHQVKSLPFYTILISTITFLLMIYSFS